MNVVFHSLTIMSYLYKDTRHYPTNACNIIFAQLEVGVDCIGIEELCLPLSVVSNKCLHVILNKK